MTSPAAPTPLWAVNSLTFLASIGTGIVWSGVAFIAKHDYGYVESQTLTLYLVLGVTYAIGAFSTGKILKLIDRWLSARSAVAIILILGAIFCMGPAFTRADWMLWVTACSVNVLSSWLWPIVESYLTAGRHGAQMRRAIGIWNLVWTSAVAMSLLIMAPLVEEHARYALVMVGGLYILALGCLPWFDAQPAAHDEDSAGSSIQPEYPFLLTSARILLPLSYILNSAMSPLLPYLLGGLGVAAFWETPAAATWTLARIVTMALMWRVAFWHGRWGTLLFGAVIMMLGFALIVTAFSLPLLLVGLAMLGVGMATIYYAALYYVMAVGRASVHAGGTHEALIGTGYAIGPATGFIGIGISRGAAKLGLDLWQGVGTVAVVWLLIGVSSTAAIRPYLRARQARTKAHVQ